MADAQHFANFFGGHPVHQKCGDLPFAGCQFGAHGARGTEVFKAPNACLMRRGAIQSATGDVAPKRFTFKAAIDALHHTVIGVKAFGIEAQLDSGARAFILVGAGVEHLERLANQLFAAGTKHVAQALVAVHHGAVA